MLNLEKYANIALRVPSLLVLDLQYQLSIYNATRHIKDHNLSKYILYGGFYCCQLISVVVFFLPLKHIVLFYRHILAVLLLHVGHWISNAYVLEELRYGYEGEVYLDSLAFSRFLAAISCQIVLSGLCAFLTKTRKFWLFSSYMLPVVARLCTAPLATLMGFISISWALTAVGICIFLLAHLFVPFRLARAAFSNMMKVFRLPRYLVVLIVAWHQGNIPEPAVFRVIPVVFSVFWFALLIVPMYWDPIVTNYSSTGLWGITVSVLTRVSECCTTPYSLLGLTVVVFYLALGLFKLCKFYLEGHVAGTDWNIVRRCLAESVTLLLLALQVNLLDSDGVSRALVLGTLLFIMLTSTLQSMAEITAPVILTLGAAENRSLWKHFRGLSMCLLLLVTPGLMVYKLFQRFPAYLLMHFWAIVLMSSCMITCLQVTVTLLIYSLYMVEMFRGEIIDTRDDVIYWVKTVGWMLEFVVSFCVMVYGTHQAMFGSLSWMGAFILAIHFYINVCLQANSGWTEFLLRLRVIKKMKSLPKATAQQLQQYNDVCGICHEEMNSALITSCGHLYHAYCLCKWWYKLMTCPSCNTAA